MTINLLGKDQIFTVELSTSDINVMVIITSDDNRFSQYIITKDDSK